MAAWKCRPTSFAIKRKCPIRAVLAIVKNKFVFPVCCIPFCLALSLPLPSISLTHSLCASLDENFIFISASPSPYPNSAQQSAARKLCVLCGLRSWSLQAARQGRDRERQRKKRGRGREMLKRDRRRRQVKSNWIEKYFGNANCVQKYNWNFSDGTGIQSAQWCKRHGKCEATKSFKPCSPSISLSLSPCVWVRW